MKKLAIALAIGFGLLLAAFGFLETQTGKAWLAAEISRAVPTLTVEGIEGNLPSDLRIARIALADRNGVWLELRNLHLAWHPLALVKKEYRVETLEAERITVSRLPEAAPGDGKSTSFSLQNLPDIRLHSLAIRTLALDAAVTGQAQTLTISGGGTKQGYTLIVKTLSGPDTSLTAQAALNGAALHAALAFQEDPGGIAGQLLALPDGTPLHAALTADTDDSGVLRWRNAALTAGSLTLSSNGEYNSRARTLAAALSLDAPDAFLLSGLAKTPLAGALQANLTAEGKLDALQFALSLQAAQLTVNGNALEPAQLQAQGRFDADALRLNAEHVKADYGLYHLTGDAKTDLKAKDFALDWALQPVAEASLRGRLQATGKAAGSFEKFTLESHAELASEEGDATLDAKGEADAKTPRFTGSIDGAFARAQQHFTLAARLSADAQRAECQEISLKGPGLTLSGQAGWDIAKKQADGRLALDAPDLRPLGSLLGQALGGRVSATLSLPPEGPIQAHATAQALTLGTTKIDTLEAHLDGASAKLQAAGSAGGAPFTLLAAGSRAQEAALMRLRLQTLKGEYAGKPFALKAPGELRLQGEQAEITPMQLAVAGGSVSIKGRFTPDKVNAELTARGLALQELPVRLPEGNASATLHLTGSMPSPIAALDGNATLDAADTPLSLAAHAHWQKEKLAANLTAATAGSGKASLNLSVIMPAAFSLAPFHIGLSGDTPISGRAALDAPLELANPYLRASGQRVGGHVSGGGAIGGRLGAPSLAGRFTLANGQYDHRESGVCLRGVSASFTGTRQAFALESLHAADSDGGTLAGHAAFALSDARPLSGVLAFSHFRLFCGGLASGDIDGKLQASGTLAAAKLAGALTLSPLNVQLPGNPQQSAIPQVKTERAGTRPPSAASAASSPLTLDIALAAPGRFFVRGRGLDAEFSGKLAITGPADKASFNGQFTSTHGSFALLDRTLKLTSAVLRFDGPVPPSPFLDVTADSNAITTADSGSSVVVHVALSGPAVKPELSFTSDPALPKDEVLALLLFGRQLSKLTPFQAASLAQSTRELAGYSSGPGVMGKLRNFLGLDTLNVDSGANNDVSVGTGKYITDKVYVGVTQGSTPESRAVTTEIELVPSVSANTAVQAGGQQSLGLQWKYDY